MQMKEIASGASQREVREKLLEAARRRAASPQVYFERFFVYLFNLGEFGFLYYIRRCH